MPTKQRDARAASNPAGELARGVSGATQRAKPQPGPKPSSAWGSAEGGSGPVPPSNTSRNQNPSNMQPLRSSRSGRAQGNNQCNTEEEQQQRGEQWLTVQAKEWERLHRHIADMAQAIARLTEQFLESQGRGNWMSANTSTERRQTREWGDDSGMYQTNAARTEENMSIGLNEPSRKAKQRRRR
jgi:hypothetical protein